VRVVDLRIGEILRSYSGHDGSVLSLSPDVSGERGVTGANDGTAHICSFAPVEDVLGERGRPFKQLTTSHDSASAEPLPAPWVFKLSRRRD
jgi:hypothetical protein